MKTSWKPLGRSLLIAKCKNVQQCLRVEERALRMMDGLAAPNMPLHENVMVMCDRRQDLGSIASEVTISFGTVQSILTDILGMSKV